MNPPSFTGSSVIEDPKNFVEELQNVFEIIKEGKETMLIGDMDIARLIIHVQQVEEDKLRDREEFKNKRAKTSGNEFGQQKNNANRSSFQLKQKGPAPSSASTHAPKNKCKYNSHNFMAEPAYS
ncbi:hypothetical protein H5410_036588 [Solanum commersonii]|uniref:Gag-pol polyprotein n=1 Tax=Solanum commersonii TaxID=4109 RepID=A0A9J5Y7W1_SOLCO|nr:hypothetical protein H5410_036588 [Solanum commersonii]